MFRWCSECSDDNVRIWFSEEPGFKLLTEGTERLRRRYLLRQSVPCRHGVQQPRTPGHRLLNVWQMAPSDWSISTRGVWQCESALKELLTKSLHSRHLLQHRTQCCISTVVLIQCGNSISVARSSLFKVYVAAGGMCRNQRIISATVPSWNVTWHVSRDSHVTTCEVQQPSSRNRDVHD